MWRGGPIIDGEGTCYALPPGANHIVNVVGGKGQARSMGGTYPSIPMPYAMPRGLGHRQPPLAFAHAPQKDAWSTGKASHCLSFIRNFFNIMRIKKRRYAQDRKPYPVPYPCATNGCLGEVFHPPIYIYRGSRPIPSLYPLDKGPHTPPCEHQWEA